jgi:hypothetical protein
MYDAEQWIGRAQMRTAEEWQEVFVSEGTERGVRSISSGAGFRRLLRVVYQCDAEDPFALRIG